tara:strand:- start:166960 stop:167769 length:810 start_codon:yes stop_codon:yes gene_type:complete
MQWNKGLLIVALLVVSGCQTNKDAKEEIAKLNEELESAQSSMYDIPDVIDYDKAAKINAELGLSYLQQGQNARAKTKLLRAMKLAPDMPDVHYAYGYYLEHIGELVEAEKSYLLAIKHDPKNGKSYNNYGAFLCRMARYRESETQFMQALKDKDYARTGEVYENAGVCVMQIPDIAKAQTYFETALRHDPNRHYAMLELAIIKYRQNNILEAQNYYSTYTKLAAPTKRSLLLGVKLAEYTGNKDQAASLKLLLQAKFPDAKTKDLFISG